MDQMGALCLYPYIEDIGTLVFVDCSPGCQHYPGSRPAKRGGRCPSPGVERPALASRGVSAAGPGRRRSGCSAVAVVVVVALQSAGGGFRGHCSVRSMRPGNGLDSDSNLTAHWPLFHALSAVAAVVVPAAVPAAAPPG